MDIITKQYMIDNTGRCISPEYAVRYLRNELVKVYTSGSTGQYLEVLWDETDYHKSMTELWIKRYKYYGIKPGDRLLFFHTFNESDEEYIHRKNQLGISKSLLIPERFNEVYVKITEWNPKWIIIQPSIMVLLINYIKSNNKAVPKNVAYIEMTGEILDNQLKAEVKNLFNCHVANQYGANEVNSIAYECPCGRMHVMESNVAVEIVDEQRREIADSRHKGKGGEDRGSIIITSLNNKAMPFIRYEIGDYGRLYPNMECPCGNKEMVLALESGRDNDSIVRSDGSKISSYEIVKLFDIVNSHTEGAIKQFYVEQRDYDVFCIRLYVEEDMEDEVVSEVYDCIRYTVLAGADIEIELTAGLWANDKTGKYKYFKNNIRK